MKNQNNIKNMKKISALHYASLFCAGILVLNCINTPVCAWALEQENVSETAPDQNAVTGRLDITVTGPNSPIIEGYQDAAPYRIQLTNPADGIDLSGLDVWTENLCDVYALVKNAETGIVEEMLVYQHPQEGEETGGSDPETPENPENPDQTENPDEAENPGESGDNGAENPEEPKNPGESENPKEPENPDGNGDNEIKNPEESGNLEGSENTGGSEDSNPTDSDEAGNPEKPENPGEAENPNDPENPTAPNEQENPGDVAASDEPTSPEEPEPPSESGENGLEHPEEPDIPDILGKGNPWNSEILGYSGDATSLGIGESLSYIVRIPAGLPAGEYTETVIIQAAELDEPIKRSFSFIVIAADHGGEDTDNPSGDTSSDGMTGDEGSNNTPENAPSDGDTENDGTNDSTGTGGSDSSTENDPSDSTTENDTSDSNTENDPSNDNIENDSTEDDPSNDNKDNEESNGATEDDPSDSNTGDEGSDDNIENDSSDDTAGDGGSNGAAADGGSGDITPDESVEEGEETTLPEESDPSGEEDGEAEEEEEPELGPTLEIVSREGGNSIGSTFFATSTAVYALVVNPSFVSALFCDLNGVSTELPVSDGYASFTIPETYNGTIRFYALDKDGNIIEETTEYVIAEKTPPVLNYENVNSPTDGTCAVRVSIEDCGDIVSGLNTVDCMVDGVPFTEYTPNVFGKVLLCSGEEADSGLSFEIPLLDDEIHTIEVNATDNAGNLLEQSFRVHASPMEVVSVVLPTTFGMTIFPYASNGNIWGDDIVIANQSDFPVEVTLKSTQVDIDHSLPENRIMKSTIPVGNTIDQPIDLTQLADDSIKDAYLDLNLKLSENRNSVLELQEGYSMPGECFILEPKNPDTDAAALQNAPNETDVVSGDYAIVNVRGTIAEGSENMWKDGDIVVSLTFTFQKLKEATDEEP